MIFQGGSSPLDRLILDSKMLKFLKELSLTPGEKALIPLLGSTDGAQLLRWPYEQTNTFSSRNHSVPKEVCYGNILFSSVNIFSILLATVVLTETEIPFFF